MDGGILHRDLARNQYRYIQLRGNDERVLVLRTPAVLVQRTTAPEQTRKLVVAELTPTLLAEWGGQLVVENHVNVLRSVTEAPLLSQTALARILATTTLDRVMRCLSGSVAVSAYEMESLHFPSAAVLQSWNNLRGSELEAVVVQEYRSEEM